MCDSHGPIAAFRSYTVTIGGEVLFLLMPSIVLDELRASCAGSLGLREDRPEPSLQNGYAGDWGGGGIRLRDATGDPRRALNPLTGLLIQPLKSGAVPEVLVQSGLKISSA